MTRSPEQIILGGHFAFLALAGEWDWRHCRTCSAYLERRRDVVARAMADRVLAAGETPETIADRFMTGVHDRHRAGETLATPTKENH